MILATVNQSLLHNDICVTRLPTDCPFAWFYCMVCAQPSQKAENLSSVPTSNTYKAKAQEVAANAKLKCGTKDGNGAPSPAMLRA